MENPLLELMNDPMARRELADQYDNCSLITKLIYWIRIGLGI